MQITNDHNKLQRLADALMRHTNARKGHPFCPAESYDIQSSAAAELKAAFAACIEG
jgi:hypothetical protein